MEKYRRPDLLGREETPSQPAVYESEDVRTREVRPESGKTTDIREIVREQLEEKARKASRRKWGGRGLIVFGAIMVLTSCPLYAVSLIGPQTLFTGLVMMAGGSALLSWRPRLKYTNEAIIVAAKYGNTLTSTRLALELDISFEKAEKIIQELVRNGMAEIDLDRNDPDHSIVYRIRGL